MKKPELSLRRYSQNDEALITKWFHLPHVKKWFKDLDDWLSELQNENKAYSFIEHFIAEVQGIPIGFGQYADVKLAAAIGGVDIAGEIGECYGIDYFIGETKYLRQGYGKELVELLIGEVSRKEGAKRVIADPDAENLISIQLLLSLGFSYVESEGIYEKRFNCLK